MSHSHPTSLIDVQVAFEHWRAQRTHRQPTPRHLRSLAVALLDQHIPFTICKALGVNASALKQWAKEEPVLTQSSFVVLPEEPTRVMPDVVARDPELSITLPNGVQLSLVSGVSLHEALAAASSVRMPA
ncbi:hypothetical protein ACUNV4_30100 [Granulosicoccus sp. 3-233]|uniref:hypothetical protein n=1 Tax=Granulosicoccus sp. 3-233 TaxID=3417969 RepID=UPI003D34BCD7